METSEIYMNCNDKYNELLDHYYYIDEIPVGKIVFIKKNDNNNYTIHLDTRALPVPFLSQGYNSICATSEMLEETYKNYLIRKERDKILKERKITDIVHFTKIENLDSILEYGLFSNDILDRLNIEYFPSDGIRFDNKTNFVCTSISFPNYKMFYKKRMEDISQDWAVIRINPTIILHKLSTEFYKMNRASSIYFNDKNMHTSNIDLQELFYEEDRDVYLPSKYTTNPQSEVLIKNSIKTNYITGVETDIKNEKVKSLTRNINIDYEYNSSLFRPRNDYERWQNDN